jgi:cell division initiation protein
MTSDLDVPLLPSSDQIRKRGFVTVRKGGFDPDQVKDYLNRVADQVETLEKELRELRLNTNSRESASASTTAPAGEQQTDAGDPYEAISKRFASMLESADKEASSVVGEAKAEAARILEQARGEADRVKLDAQARAEEARQQAGEALAQAREEANRILGGLAERRESLLEQMNEMRSRLLSVADNLEVDLDAPPPLVVEPEPGDSHAQMPAAATPPTTAEGSVPASPASAAGTGEDLVDPRYEDLWTSSGSSVDLPDLATLDIDFDDERDAD